MSLIKLFCLFILALVASIESASISIPQWKGNKTQGKIILREARIILPQNYNNGTSLLPVKEELEPLILLGFGGFTLTEGTGGWESESDIHNFQNNDERVLHHEPVWIYDIGCVDNEESEISLTKLATWLKEVAAQESVYLRLPNGAISFV